MTSSAVLTPGLLERGVVTMREEVMPGVWKLRLHSPRIAVPCPVTLKRMS